MRRAGRSVTSRRARARETGAADVPPSGLDGLRRRSEGRGRGWMRALGWVALLTCALWAGQAGAQEGDSAVVLTETVLSVEGLKTEYAPREAMAFTLRVPRNNVVRARAEVTLMRDDVAGAPVYQSLREYDRYTGVDAMQIGRAHV